MVEKKSIAAEIDESLRGHTAHSKAADTQKGLPGSVGRSLNITFIGAGSGFCPRICRDIMMISTAEHGCIKLVDIDSDRLETMVKVIEKVIVQANREKGWSVQAFTDRCKALPDTDYVINSIEVSGLECVAFDNDIPLKYGVDQCIGDTIGPGGLFKGLRTVPVFLDMLRDIQNLCPDALVLSYTNPMNMMILAAGRAVPDVRVVGLCHSVQGTSHQLARYADVPYEELEWNCAGINHLAWFTKLRHKGKDLYESVLYEKFRHDLLEAQKEADGGEYKYGDLVRKDMCLQFGAFITESSGHLSEYLPYYRKNRAGKELLRNGYEGESRFYAGNWPDWRKYADEERLRLVSGDQVLPMDRSWEYVSWIIEAIEKNSPFVIYGNVINSQNGSGPVIGNLLHDGCVEVACTVDGNGVTPMIYGELPPQMAAICRSNQSFFDLAAQAAVDLSIEDAVHAMMLDPLTAAVLSPTEIRAMTMEMFEAEKNYLPEYS